MSAGDNRKLLEEHFAAKVRRDEAVLRSQMTDGVRWWAPQSTEARGVKRPHAGLDEVMGLLMSTGFYRTERTWTIHQLVVEDDRAAAHVTLTTQTASGQPYENQYAFIFLFKDGLIDEVFEHLDTAYAYELLDKGRHT